MSNLFEFQPIAHVQTPFKDKFALPRQSGMAKGATGLIQFEKNEFIKQALRTIEEFSHLWIVFVFHETGSKNWKPSIRPPRFGGRKKVGVLASRSPHRPNPIGISAVKILSVDLKNPLGPQIKVEGVDLLDGTPVLDVKPYIAYTDRIEGTVDGWAQEQIPSYPVHFSEEALEQLKDLPELHSLIRDVIELDPRPAFQRKNLPADSPESWGRDFGFDLEGFEIKYTISNSEFWVQKIFKID